MSNLTRVTVIGAGLLGGQIAWHSAHRGKTVVVHDLTEDVLNRCRDAHATYAGIYADELGASESELADTRSRLTYTTDIAEATREADLVIEAVPENPDIKHAVYKQLADVVPAHTLLATNSSTLLPSTFAASTGRPEKFCALHFGNGIWAMNFAEVMAHPDTSRETVTAITEFAVEIGMVPIPVAKEQNGYVVNTWFVALTNAAQTLVTNGVARPEDVDRSYMIGGAKVGPIAMLDAVGLQLAHDVLGYWGEVNGDAQMSANAAYLKEHFLDRGLLGAPTGQGYYTYPDPAFAAPDFLDVPAIGDVPAIVARVMGE